MATKIDDGGQAFPMAVHGEEGYPGMTLRDYFAAQALAALISKAPMFDEKKEHGIAYDQHERGLDYIRDCMALSAYGYADAMLTARKGVR